MNPVLLEADWRNPCTRWWWTGSRWGICRRGVFPPGNKQDFVERALAAYQRLSGRYNPIVLEGEEAFRS